MQEIAVSDLEPELRRLAVMARDAAANRDAEVARDLSLQILRQQPGCLSVRELWFEAELESQTGRSNLLSRAKGLFARAKSRKTTTQNSTSDIASADAILAEDFTSRSGWIQLIQASELVSLNSTELLASRTYARIFPDDIEAGLKLAKSLHRNGRLDESLQQAQQLLNQHPNSAEVLAFFRKVSVEVTMQSGRLRKPNSE